MPDREARNIFERNIIRGLSALDRPAPFFLPQFMADMVESKRKDVEERDLKEARAKQRASQEQLPTIGKAPGFLENVLGTVSKFASDEAGEALGIGEGQAKIDPATGEVEMFTPTAPSMDVSFLPYFGIPGRAARRAAKAAKPLEEQFMNFRRLRLPASEEKALRENVLASVERFGLDPKQVESHTSVLEAAKSIDPELVRHVSASAEKGIGNRAARFAMRQRINTLNREIVEASQSIRTQPLSNEQMIEAQRLLGEKEASLQKYIAEWAGIRSMDGRNLAMHRMMADSTWDVTYWLDRAAKGAGLPRGVPLPDAQAGPIRKILAEGTAAEQEATERVIKARQKVAGQSAGQPLGVEGAGPVGPTSRTTTASKRGKAKKVLTREEASAQAKQFYINQLKAKLKHKATPVTLEEKAEWASDPVVKQLKDAIRLQSERAKNLKLVTREDEVAKAKKRLMSSLEAQLRGKKATTNPVSPEERLAFETDPDIQTLRTKIEAKRAREFVPPSTEQKVERGVGQTVKRIEDKLAGKEPTPSPWRLTDDEKQLVNQDPRVVDARRRLAKAVHELDKHGWVETLAALRKANLLTGIKTHLRNIGGNAGFQVMEEVAKLPAALVDIALAAKTGRRTVAGSSPMAVLRAGQEAATKGIREAGQIMRHGATAEDILKTDFPRELMSNSPLINKYVNTVFRSLAAEDRVFKVYAMRRSLEAQARVRALNEVRDGLLGRADVAARTRELVASPDAAMSAKAIYDADFATFNNANPLADAIMGGKARLKVAGKTAESQGARAAADALYLASEQFAPFVRTPTNLVARTVDYSGLSLVPKVGFHSIRSIAKKELTEESQKAIAEVVGRGGTGAAALLFGYHMASEGKAEGAGASTNQRNASELAGRLPGSIKVGGEWHSILTFSPVGPLVSMGASLYQESTMELKDEAKRPGKAAAVLMRTILELPMLQSLQEVERAVSQPDSQAQRVLARQAGSTAVPAIVSDIGGAIDPLRREATSGEVDFFTAVAQGVQSRAPFLREYLPPRRDAFGNPLESRDINAVNPFLSTTAQEDIKPHIAEIKRLRVGVGKPSRYQGESNEEFELRKTIVGKFMEGATEATLKHVMYGDPTTTDPGRKDRLEAAMRWAQREVREIVTDEEYSKATVQQRVEILNKILSYVGTPAWRAQVESEVLAALDR